MYQGKTAEPQAELHKMTQKARTDCERRTALFGQTVVAIDSGKLDQALAEVEKQYAVAQKNNDAAAMTGDLQLKGNVLLEAGKYEAAKEAFVQAVKTTTDSSLSQQVKDNAERFSHYNFARVAVAKKDLATAKTETETFRKGAETAKNANQLKQAHELAGRIALEEKNYDNAISELSQANQQNPDVLYLTAQAYKAKGDAANAKTFFTKAAKFNSLPQLNYAFIRNKAEKALAS
jgi:tetratricopeptide (TPR) repeat protein